MFTFAYEYPSFYQIIVTDGSEENSFTFEFTKEQDVEASVREALLLGELEKAKKQPPTPMPV